MGSENIPSHHIHFPHISNIHSDDKGDPKRPVLRKEVWSLSILHVGQQTDNMVQPPESLLEVHEQKKFNSMQLCKKQHYPEMVRTGLSPMQLWLSRVGTPEKEKGGYSESRRQTKPELKVATEKGVFKKNKKPG